MLKLSEKQTLTVHNKMELGEDISVEAKGKGRKFVSRFIEPGVAHYEEFGDVLITKETLDRFINTMVGCPVIIQHKDIDDENVDKERVGVISNVWFNEFDGWYYCDGIIWDKQAIDLIKNQEWSVSCTYDFDSDKLEKTHNGKKIDMEFTGGEFLHLALVPNPRYERANIVMNAKDQPRDENGRWIKTTGNEYFDENKKSVIKEMSPDEYIKECSERMGIKIDELIESRKDKRLEQIKEKFNAGEKFNIPYLHYQNDDFKQDGLHRTIAVKELGDKNLPVMILDERSDVQNSKGDLIMSVLNELESFVKGIIKNAEDEKEKEEVKNEDKRKLIDEVGGILKGKVDDEIIKTIMKKMEETSYEPSEDKKADNEADEEEKEEKFEEEKKIANKCKNEEEKEEKEDKVEDEDDEKDEDDEVDKEEVKNKCKNSMKDVKEIIMGGKSKVESDYISKADRFALGEKY